MSRSATYTALCLRVRPWGESNREAFFLTAEEGILRAIVYGGPKSKLRAYASPYNQGTLWIYHDPSKDSRKLTDFDVKNWRPGLRELYERTIACGAVAETILASHGGGGAWEYFFDAAEKTLNALEKADGKLCPRLVIHFLWNWAGLLGVRPDIRTCASCACGVKPDEVLWFNTRDASLVCARCFNEENGSPQAARAGSSFAISAGAHKWLLAVQDLDAGELSRISLDGVSQNQAKALAEAVLAEALGKRLSSWDACFVLPC
jgi:DNA repair protein RecO (recombination protein O)